MRSWSVSRLYAIMTTRRSSGAMKVLRSRLDTIILCPSNASLYSVSVRESGVVSYPSSLHVALHAGQVVVPCSTVMSHWRHFIDPPPTAFPLGHLNACLGCRPDLGVVQGRGFEPRNH